MPCTVVEEAGVLLHAEMEAVHQKVFGVMQRRPRSGLCPVLSLNAKFRVPVFRRALTPCAVVEVARVLLLAEMLAQLLQVLRMTRPPQERSATTVMP